MINSLKRDLLYFIMLDNRYLLPSRCWTDLNLFLRIWSPIYKKNFQARHSSSGVCNHLGIFMVVSGIKMVAACSMSHWRNPRYELMMVLHTFCAFLPRFYLTITILSWFHIKIIFNTLYVFQVFINLYWGSRRRFQFLALAWKKNQDVLFKVKIC